MTFDIPLFAFCPSEHETTTMTISQEGLLEHWIHGKICKQVIWIVIPSQFLVISQNMENAHGDLWPHKYACYT